MVTQEPFRIDAITLEVLWSRLIAVVNEQAAALMRTSFTPVVREAGDLSACLFDRKGRMVAQAVTGTPGHINSIADIVPIVLKKFPEDSLRPGDVFVTNDPWDTSGQLNDLTVVTPVFREGRLVGFFGNCCHHYDIGGRIRSAEAKDVFEEGLYLPMLRLYEAGQPNATLFDLLVGNVRHPELTMGDLHSQVVANDVGAAALVQTLDEFGLEDLVPVADEILDRSEAAFRRNIAAVPPGEYENEYSADGYEEPIKLKVRLTFASGGVVADYTGTSPQSRYGINVVLNYTRAYNIYALKCALCPEVPNNAGGFRPIRVTAPAGCLLNPSRPAPVGARATVGHLVPGLIFGALAKAVPDRVMASGSEGLWITHFNGEKASGDRFSYTLLLVGGTGARPNKDGLSATAFPSGIRGVSTEVIEATAPLLILEKSLREDSGGAGQYRGGLGQRVRVRVRTEKPYWMAPITERLRHPAPGLLGGKPGAAGAVRLNGTESIVSKEQRLLPPESELIFETPGGGGYGDSRMRAREAIQADVLDGLVSPERARSDQSESQF